MPDKTFTYSDPSTFNQITASNATPFGIYNTDKSFVSESLSVCKFVSRKLGHPVMQLEFNSGSIYACYEEAVSDYSTYINNYNTKNWLWDFYGNESRQSGSTYNEMGSQEPVKPNLGLSSYLSDKYGEEAQVGGSATLHSGSITLEANKQVYNLQTEASYSNTSHVNERLEIRRVFNYGPSSITRFYDPFAGSFEQRNMLDNFGMGNVSPATTFILRPIYWDITRASAIETNDRVRKSNYSFELVNNQIRIFPSPESTDAGDLIYFQYYIKSNKNSVTRDFTNNKVTDPSNIPYKFITYAEINSTGRQWIRRYTLALAKELLGIIRSKYASMPLPNGEVSLDGESLKAEGREEKQQLIDELKEFLDSVSLEEKSRVEQEIANAQQEVLNKAPYMIYIG